MVAVGLFMVLALASLAIDAVYLYVLKDRLQMTGSSKGGGMWNDLPNSRSSGDGVYDVKGYYIEYGGPGSYDDNFSDRRLGATFTINLQECALVRAD